MKSLIITITLLVILIISSSARATEDQTYRIVTNNTVQAMTVVTNDFPILLTGNQVLTIDSQDYTIRNDITLRDNAQLIIKNSKFNHQHTYSFQYWLNAYDSSRVIIMNSTLISSDWLNWNFYNSASLEMTSVVNSQSLVWHNMHDNASAVVSGASKFHGGLALSVNMYLENIPMTFIETIFPPNATVDETFPANVGARKTYVFPNTKDFGLNTKLTMKNTGKTYSNWGITYVPGDNITIRNTKALTVTFCLSYTVSGVTAEFNGLRAGYYANQTWTTGNASLKLIKTTTSRWSPIVMGTNTLILNDSELADNAFSFGNAQIYVNRSSLSFLRGNDAVRMYISDSSVSEDVVATGNSVIELKNSTVSGQMIEQDNGQIVVMQ